MNVLSKSHFILAIVVSVVFFSAQSIAEEQAGNDKTGTNPVNFQREFRINNEFLFLNTAGDGTQNLITAEFRAPFAGGKWQWRVRARFNSLTADFNNDGIDDVDESGMGDIDMRFLTVFKIDMAKKEAWAGGLEVFFDTSF